MVAVVVDHGIPATAVLLRHGIVAPLCEAAAHALESGQRLADGLVGHAQLGSHGDGRQRIAHVMQSRQIEFDVERRQLRIAVAATHGETHARAFGTHILGAHLRLGLRP